MNDHTPITAPPPRNPHCNDQWPRNFGAYPLVAGLIEASYGARTVAELLYADHQIATDRADADDPALMPMPFTANTAAGLRAALNVCLSEIAFIAEKLENCEVRRVER